jgi:ADP-ribosylglycohydrolase
MIDKAAGCLFGSAIGDAMGMPASFMSPEQVKRNYGRITDFLKPASEQVAHGYLHRAEITDDTQETIILAQTLIEAKGFDEQIFIDKMRRWAVEQDMLSSTVIGPSTRRFLEAIIKDGDYLEIGKSGVTNGAAMRVAPVGIFYHGDPEKACREAMNQARVSHGSVCGLASAAAVAAAVSLAVEGHSTPEEVMDAAIAGAITGEQEGADIPAPKISRRLILAKEIVDKRIKHDSLEAVAYELYALFGAGMKSYESIPLSLGVSYAAGFDFKSGLITVINIGDDADTNGAITGALCGAYSGLGAIPLAWQESVEQQNSMNLHKLAEDLLNG